MFNIYKYLFWFLFFPGFVLYFLQQLVCAYYYKTQNLKKRYSAQWALVTGASSGIGKSIAIKLAGQGLNVVLVALGDDLLDRTFQEMQDMFPNLQFRKVPADLGGNDYLPGIAQATKDISVQIVFCNAGYLLTGFFFARELPALMANMNCNATSAVQITHLFTSRMIAAKQKGCVVFTSSAAACMPSPFSVLYAATKSFLAAFGASLAAEVRPYGIDILVFFPSPVATRFYDNVHRLQALEFFKKFAVKPEELPDAVFASIGRTIFRDLGPTALTFRLLPKVLDYGALAFITALTGSTMGDFKTSKIEADRILAERMAKEAAASR